MKKKPYLGIMVVSAFACLISAFQINSYHADVHHLNGNWLAAAISFGVVAITFLILSYKTPKE